MSWNVSRAVLVTASALFLITALPACDREYGYAMRQPRQRRVRYVSQPGYYQQPYYGNSYGGGGYYNNGYGQSGYYNNGYGQGGYYAQPRYSQPAYQPAYEPRGRSGYAAPGYQGGGGGAVYVAPPSRSYSPGPSFGSSSGFRGGVPNVGPRR